MFKFDQDFSWSRKKITPWVNKCKYIILHHNAWGNLKPSTDYILRPDLQIGYHFLIGDKWEAIKFAWPDKIVRHAWVSEWGNDWNISTWWSLNWCSIGLCILWPNKQGGFTKQQRDKAKELIVYLMKVFNIPAENVLTHTAITQLNGNSKIKKLPDLNTPSRKKDVARTFWTEQWFKSFSEYQKSLK